MDLRGMVMQLNADHVVFKSNTSNNHHDIMKSQGGKCTTPRRFRALLSGCS